MNHHINTIAFSGIETILVNVQIHMIKANFFFTIVGLGDKAIAESRERIWSALSSIGINIPFARVVINLAPADLVKEGTHYDLPITVAILAGMGIIPAQELSSYIIMGELHLDGSIASVAGILPAAIHATGNNMSLICPHANGQEARWAGNLKILAPKHLLDIINHFKGSQILSEPSLDSKTIDNLKLKKNKFDIADVKGQFTAKRGLEIAAAGNHNLLMVGPPGSGKSMLASRINTILPPLTNKEILEINMIASIKGNLSRGEILLERPFRSPHHSCSMAAMVGGGKKAAPGEITLAHRGVLFLDELPEFTRSSLEALRQPLESGNITVSRANAHLTYPADFQLIAAMNPCRCGYLGDAERSCKQAPNCGKLYQNKLSGPFLDRIDLQIDVNSLNFDELQKLKNIQNESSEQIQKKVIQARNIQIDRYKELGILTNNQASSELINKISNIDNDGQKLIEHAFKSLKLSMRSYTRILRVARTIADLRNNANIEYIDIAESLSFRRL